MKANLYLNRKNTEMSFFKRFKAIITDNADNRGYYVEGHMKSKSYEQEQCMYMTIT